jgi:hypothetical protein
MEFQTPWTTAHAGAIGKVTGTGKLHLSRSHVGSANSIYRLYEVQADYNIILGQLAWMRFGVSGRCCLAFTYYCYGRAAPSECARAYIISFFHKNKHPLAHALLNQAVPVYTQRYPVPTMSGQQPLADPGLVTVLNPTASSPNQPQDYPSCLYFEANIPIQERARILEAIEQLPPESIVAQFSRGNCPWGAFPGAVTTEATVYKSWHQLPNEHFTVSLHWVNAKR